MKLKDENKFRSLFALKGIHKQVDMAKAIFLSENSMVRLFKGEKINSTTANRIASFLGCEVDDIFEVASPKILAPVLAMAA